MPQFCNGAGGNVLDAASRTALEGLVMHAERSQRLDKVEKGCVTAQELSTWRKQSALPSKVLDALSTLARHEAKRAESARLIAAHQANIESTFNNQHRLRENIKSLEVVGKNALTDRYLADLDKEEDELINTRRTIAALEEEDASTKVEIEETKLALALEVCLLSPFVHNSSAFCRRFIAPD